LTSSQFFFLQRADRVEGQLAAAKKSADEADAKLEKAMRDVQAARAEVRKEAERADTLEDSLLAKHKELVMLKASTSSSY
jgi:F0F1-type ATP synthase membrane subunit b/b'